MSKSDLRIDILGIEITISADEEPDYLNMLLEKYRRTIENVKRMTGLSDPLKTAVLTGFLLCDDLEKAGFPAKGKDEESGEAEQLTLGMISRLDAVVRESSIPYNAGVSGASGGIYKLQNAIKNYDWGSPEWLPELLGEKNLSRLPWAELWMGVNPAGPSRVSSGITLSELIDREKETFLGKEAAQNFGTLPFLLKVLAAAKPLSIQAHPNLEQARDGFERENREGIPLEAPNRNFRDQNHKSEIICALDPFTLLCGFRNEKEIYSLVDILFSNCEDGLNGLKTSIESLLSALKAHNPLKTFLSELFGIESEKLNALGSFIKTRQIQLEKDFPEYKDEWGLCAYLANLFSGDPGVIAPLFLNIIELERGEAICLSPGVLHSYIHGMGIELTGNSDNVLRGGLSSKHLNQEGLLEILSFSEYRPEILNAPDLESSWFSYPSPDGEFTLSVLQGSGAALPFPGKGPSILIVTRGNAYITEPGNNNEMALKTGESVFISAGKSPLISGVFTAYAASL